MTMTLGEIVEDYGKQYRHVSELHERCTRVPGQRVPDELVENVRELCQRSLDAICALVDEPWVEKVSEHYKTVLTLIEMLEGFDGLAASIQNRPDVPPEEAKRIDTYRAHKKMRVERLKRMIQQQDDNRVSVHAQVAR